MSGEKRQDLPVGLWVVATPIGNISDLSLRARAALEGADAVLCEDTRHTSKLLAALGILGKSLLRLDAHASVATISKMTDRLLAGESLALVTDAGTPGVSDPGARLVAAARAAGVTVTPVPGPSAVMALLSVAGFERTCFSFRGFFPRKTGERRDEIAQARHAGGNVGVVAVWFESPQRVSDALATLAEAVPSANVFVAKELTKAHERFFSGAAMDVAQAVAVEIGREGPRGEWCIACDLEPEELAESSDWVKALQCLLDVRVPASEAARQVSQHFGVSRKSVYELAVKLSHQR